MLEIANFYIKSCVLLITQLLTKDLSVFNTKIAREARKSKGLLIKINDKSATQTLLNDNGSLKCVMHK